MIQAFASGGKGASFSAALLGLVFNGNPIAGIADNAASGAATVLCLNLHTADPGPGGTSTTNVAAYPGYAPVSLARNSGGWAITGATVSPSGIISWPVAGAGASEVEDYWSAAIPTSGSTCTGSLTILYRGVISPVISVSSGVIPQIATTTAITEK